MSLNPFFEANAINSLKSATFSTTTTVLRPSNSIKKIKRISSLSSCKLNPEKFTFRQTFSNNIYQPKAFNISVQLNKQQLATQKYCNQFQLLSSHLKPTTKLQYKKLTATFQNSLNNLINYFKTAETSNLQNQIGQNYLKSIMDTLQKLMKTLQKQFIDKQLKYTQLLFKSKASIAKNSIKQGSNEGEQSRLELSKLVGQSQDLKKINMEKKIKELSQKLKKVQFENSKLKLLCQSLKDHIQTRNSQFIQIGKQNEVMKQKLKKVKQGQDFLQHKIKKLKQQLQVAHIVKQQNLAQKMEYIMKFKK